MKRQQRLPWVTQRQFNFVLHYRAEQGNGAKAAKLAGYHGSAASLAVTASRLLKQANVRGVLEDLTAAGTADLREKGDAEMEFLAAITRANPIDLYDEAGRLIPIHQLPREIGVAIKTIKPTRYGLAIELRDSIRSAEIRLRIFGKLKDTVKVESVTLEEILARSWEQAQEPAKTEASGPDDDDPVR